MAHLQLLQCAGNVGKCRGRRGQQEAMGKHMGVWADGWVARRDLRHVRPPGIADSTHAARAPAASCRRSGAENGKQLESSSSTHLVAAGQIRGHALGVGIGVVMRHRGLSCLGGGGGGVVAAHAELAAAGAGGGALWARGEGGVARELERWRQRRWAGGVVGRAVKVKAPSASPQCPGGLGMGCRGACRGVVGPAPQCPTPRTPLTLAAEAPAPPST